MVRQKEVQQQVWKKKQDFLANRVTFVIVREMVIIFQV